MAEWWVVTSAYNLRIGDSVGLREFEVGDVTFRAFPDAAKRYAEGRSKNQHFATAEVVVKLDAETAQEAVERVEREVLPPFSLALSLAEGHNVFFWGYRCYEEGVKEGEPAYWSIPRVWTGERTGYGAILYIPPKLPLFLETVIPKLRDQELMKGRGLRLALVLYLEPIRTADLPLELSFVSYWLALEVLARHHARKRGNPTILGEEEFNRIRQAVESVLEQVAPRQDIRNQILGRLGWFNELPIRGQIDLLLKDHGLPAYTDEVKDCYKRRNDLLHGRDTPRKDFVRDFRHIQKLDEKVILKLLAIYGEDYLHRALARRNLLAR